MNYIPSLLLEGPMPGQWAFSEATQAATGQTQLQPARDISKALSDQRNALWRQERQASSSTFWRYLGALEALDGTVARSDTDLTLADPDTERVYVARSPAQDGIATYAHIATERRLVLVRLSVRLVQQVQVLAARLPLGTPAGPEGPNSRVLEDFAACSAALALAAGLLVRAADTGTPDRLKECVLGDSDTLRRLGAEQDAYVHELAFYLAVYRMRLEGFSEEARVAQSAALARTFAALGANYQRSDHAGIRLRARAAYWRSQAHRTQMRTLKTFDWSNHAAVSFQAKVDRGIVCRHIAALDASNAAMEECLRLIEAHPTAFPDHVTQAFFNTQNGQLADRVTFHADLSADVKHDAGDAPVSEGNAPALPTQTLVAPRAAVLPPSCAEADKRFRLQHAAFFALFEAGALSGLSDEALLQEAWADLALTHSPAQTPGEGVLTELDGRGWHPRIARLLERLQMHDPAPTTFEQGLAGGALMERLLWLNWLLAQSTRQQCLTSAELEAQIVAVDTEVGHLLAVRQQQQQ